SFNPCSGGATMWRLSIRIMISGKQKFSTGAIFRICTLSNTAIQTIQPTGGYLIEPAWKQCCAVRALKFWISLNRKCIYAVAANLLTTSQGRFIQKTKGGEI